MTHVRQCDFEKESGFRKKKMTDHNGKTREKTVVTQTVRSRQRDGEAPEDLHVLRPIQDYGNFLEDGRFESFEASDTDTILQKKVKKTGLTRMEIIALVLWTGPCFMLYNGLLRGFGNCCEVKSDVEFSSPEFWDLHSKVSVASRMEEAGHKYASTLYALASVVKKLQIITEDGQGRRARRERVLDKSRFLRTFFIVNHTEPTLASRRAKLLPCWCSRFSPSITVPTSPTSRSTPLNVRPFGTPVRSWSMCAAGIHSMSRNGAS